MQDLSNHSQQGIQVKGLLQAGKWKTNLFQCFNDPLLCIFEFLCPCCTGLYITYKNFKELEGDSTARKQCCLACLLPLCCYAMNRGKIRESLQIEGSCSGDFCTHICCHCCAILQEGREIKIQSDQTQQAGRMKNY